MNFSKYFHQNKKYNMSEKTKSTSKSSVIASENTDEEKLYTRQDIIHAYTSGHNDANSRITHSNGLMEYKKRNII